MNAWRNTLSRSFLHRRLWLNDPDCLMLRTDRTQLEPEQMRAWALAVGVSGGMALVSDDLALLGADARALLDEVVALGREADAGRPPAPLPRPPRPRPADAAGDAIRRAGRRPGGGRGPRAGPAHLGLSCEDLARADAALARLAAQGEHPAGRLVEPRLVEPPGAHGVHQALVEDVDLPGPGSPARRRRRRRWPSPAPGRSRSERARRPCQGVGDGDAVEALVAEELVHPRHEAGGLVAPDLRVGDVADHHRLGAVVDQCAERNEVRGLELGEGRVVDGDAEVRVAGRRRGPGSASR